MLVLSACTAPAVPGRMTAPLSEAALIGPTSGLRQAIQLGTVEVARQEDPIRRLFLTDEVLATALRQSLATHAMAAPDGAGRFRLDARLVRLQPPLAGFSYEVPSTLRYRLTSLSSGAVVFDREVSASFTQPFSGFMTGEDRMRLAMEGTMRENMRRFLATLVAEEAANPVAFGGTAPVPVFAAPPPPQSPAERRAARAREQQLY